MQPQAWDVVVVGSANVDVTLDVPVLPRPGQTVLSRRSRRGPGGKGANQALASARMGARTAFAGRVGADDGGALLRAELQGAGVDVTELHDCALPTGTAYVLLDPEGENAIVVDPGANGGFDEPTATELGLVRSARVLLCQLEIPLTAVAAAFASTGGVRVLNAAPARALPAELLELLDVLVVNEHEALTLASGAGTAEEAARALAGVVPTVVVTLGARGALVTSGRDQRPVAGLPARQVVDTTGAGDTFCGALAAGLAAGADAVAAAELGCAAASLSVERPGAGSASPLLAEVRARLADQGPVIGPQGTGRADAGG